MMVRNQIMQSFVARIWLERPDDAEPQWRGHIRHIQGCEETYFHDLEEMSEFMQQVSGIPGTRPGTDPDKVVTMKKSKPKTGRKIDLKNGDD